MDSPGAKRISRKNPRASASILSALTFAWTFDLFRRGFRRDLEISDLCEPLPEHKSQLLGNKFEEHWKKELEAHRKNPKRKPSLIRVIAKVYLGKICFITLCTCICEFVFRLGQPLLLSQLIEYFTPGSTVTYNEAIIYASGVVLCVGLNLITVSPCILANTHLGMKVRVALCSLIYRKSLKLSKEACSKIGAGQVVNILSNDASRFDHALVFMPDVIISPLAGIVVTYLIWREAGLHALIGVGILLLLVPLQGVLAKKTATLRYRIAVKTDQRIRLMSEIVTGIQVIKMYAWEKSFAKLVSLARRKEVAVIRVKSFTVGVLNTASAFSTKVALYASLLAYATLGNLAGDDTSVMRASTVYFMVLCFTIVEDNFIFYFPMAVGHAAEAFVSIRRIESFLMSEEATDAVEEKPKVEGHGEIEMNNVCAKWSPEQADNTLENINVSIRPGSLVAVIGSVGSGKSSFFQLILRELPVLSGILKAGGTVSYASQEPWLFGGTVCQNILFDLPMDKEKYRRVVRVCALETDFAQLPQGDKTVIGDRGVSLSGGQRARINLARAVYREADIYLLDDPLSAVDTHVSRHLFEECISGYLAGKTVVLATHHVQRLTNVGHVIKLDAGQVTAQGSFQELSTIGVDLSSVEEPAKPGKEEKEEVIKRMSLHDLASREDIHVESEMSKGGRVNASVYFSYFKAVNNLPLVIVVASSFVLITIATSGTDLWLKYWVNLEEYGFPENITIPLIGAVDRRACIIVYGVILAILIILAIVRAVLYSIMCLRSSIRLHDSLFTSISQTTMNFFNQTPSGQILNRFSRDMGIIDEVLPETLADCIRSCLLVIGSLAMIFTVNWYLLLPFLLVMVTLYFLRQYYLSTSRSIIRIEAITRSPIYTHVNATLQGLITIRAMHAEERLSQEFHSKLDIHSSAWYYILGTNRAFAYYLDLVCCVYISVVTFSFLVLDMDFLGGDVGLAITQSMGLTFFFQWCIRQSADVENEMTSVERVTGYTKIESERKHLLTPSDIKLYGWPSCGAIQFNDVSLFYDLSKPPVLKKINLSISPGEKIGVVGRTGAGKSSLIAALFRLQKIDGNIYIDGIDTGTIGLHDLRSRISIIPQDPVIFSGTMRFNLDPFEEFNDVDLWKVLEEVELKSVVQDNAGGLHTNLSEGGTNLSVGQRQLVCLARAILRNSMVLILDEATANVDAATDNFIQAMIRKRFRHCTVLTIAHRLHTIMDSDRVLVMDNGKVAEFGPPQVLMLDPKGHFAGMVGKSEPMTSLKSFAEMDGEKKLKKSRTDVSVIEKGEESKVESNERRVVSQLDDND